jgi:hypothetical protein
MRTPAIFRIIVSLVTTTTLLTGCLLSEDQGTTTVGTPVTAPPDFQTGQGEVPEPPEAPVPTPTPTPAQTIPGHVVIPNDEIDFIVSKGAARIREPDLYMQMVAPGIFYSAMRISYQADCKDGDWEPFSESAIRPVPNKNASNIVAVRYKDDDNVVTQCLVRSLQHDDLGPDVLISKFPMITLEQGSTAQISYSVSDASPIAGVVCSLNQLSKPCDAGNVNVDLTALMEGSYTFSVEAMDVLGNSSRREVSWQVVSTTKHLVQSIAINNYNKVDILIVDDNSGSMQYEQRSMANRTGNFLSVLKGLDWRIAMTTTDMTATSRRNAPGQNPAKVSDGLFLPIYGLSNQYYIESTMPNSDAQYRLGMTLQRPETGSGSEQAIAATYRTVERATEAGEQNPVQRDFFRAGAHFAVLVISDEDESANGAKNNPENLLSLVNTTWNGQKAFSWHSIITKPGDTECRNTYGATYGERYNGFSLLTGGVIGSVCATDYAQQVEGVAAKIRNLVKTMTLTCAPLSQFPVQVLKDGAPYAGAFTVEGINLNFAAELEPGNYSIDYHCLK